MIKKITLNKVKDRILEIREKRLMTWEAIAKEIGVHRTTVMNTIDYHISPSPLTFMKMVNFIERNSDILL